MCSRQRKALIEADLFMFSKCAQLTSTGRYYFSLLMYEW